MSARPPLPVRALGAAGLVCVLAGLLAAFTAGRSAAAGDGPADGRYIVVYEGRSNAVGAETREREQQLEFEADYRWTHALDGFAAELDAGQLAALRADPAVDFISPDGVVSIDARVPIHPAEPFPPTGVRRFLAADAATVRERSGVGVAVIDTGLQLDHPDLTASAGTNCIDPGTPPDDEHGHGTHVAGTIAAENDGAGVVGVAPGTTVYAVKVLDGGGYGTRASVICGIDWVTANAGALGIRVANMSLGGGGDPPTSCGSTTDPEHLAICRSTAAGVNYAVAAGNDSAAFDSYIKVPAVYPEVLTVTAVSDSDGAPGAIGGSPACRAEDDDEPAEFSNWAGTAQGEAHTIAAPGVCIRSSWLGSGYHTISGTSMAAPHIAGALALCIDEAGVPGACAGRSTDEVIDLMRATAGAYNTQNPGYGFANDPLHGPVAGEYYGFMSRAPGDEPPPPPPPPPDNDGFADAVDLGSGTPALATGRNVSATKETGEPDHAGNAGGASVWYRWTAPLAGDAVVDACDSSFDTLLAIYRGNAVGSLTPVAANDNGCSAGAGSKARFAVAAGETYRIAVDGVGGGGHRARQGSIELGLRVVQPPVNDHFADATDLGGGLRVGADGSNLDASVEAGEPSHTYYGGGASVWYRWTAPRSGAFTVEACGSVFDPALAVYTGASVAALERVSSLEYYGGSCALPSAVFEATAGTAYAIAVDGQGESQGRLRVDLAPRPPANDRFIDAAYLSGTRPTNGTNFDATEEPGEPDHAADPGGASVWYRWVAPATAEFVLDTCASDFDTVVGVYTGSSIGALTEIQHGDEGCASGAGSRMAFAATRGSEYAIAVDGASDGAAAAQGSFTIDFDTEPPANDQFAAALELGGGETARQTGSNAAATSETGEPVHGVGAAGASVWYRWTAPRDGTFVLDLCGSSFETVAALYTGASLTTLEPVAAHDHPCGWGNRLVFDAVSGATYMLAVDGANPAEGALELDLHLRRPDNDNLADASELYGSQVTSGENVQATKETGEPAHAGDPGGASVWYRWTAPVDREVTFETCSGSLDSVLGVYTGAAVAGLTEVESADGGCDAGGGSRVAFDAVSGTRYAIAIDGRAGAEGPYELRVRLQPPANDPFANAVDLGSGVTAATTGSNLWATTEPAEPNHGWGSSASVWYRWTAPSSGTVEVDLCGSSYDTVLAVYAGAALGSLQPVASNDDRCGLGSGVSFAAVGGARYQIAVDGYHGSQGAIDLEIRYGSTSPPPPGPPPDGPANDHIVFATPIPSSPFATSGDNVGATKEIWETGHAGDPGGASVWYRMTAPASGPVFVSLCESGFDTLVSVYHRTGTGPASPVSANDDGCGNRSFTSFPAVAGETYWIAVDGAVDGAGRPAQGAFLLRVGQYANALPGPVFDVTPPDTFINRGPGPRRGSARPRFYFASNEPGVAFQCALDSPSFRRCNSGDRFKVGFGRHTLLVRARDLARHKDPTPAAVNWTRKRR